MNENAKQVLRYLRSGKIPQITGRLRDSNGCCGEGVMCHAYEQETGEKLPRYGDFQCVYAGNMGVVQHPQVMAWMGLKNTVVKVDKEDAKKYRIEGDHNGDFITSIPWLNDRLGLSLPEIADFIEKYQDQFFE